MELSRGTHAYAVQANWKLLAENSVDDYHVGPTHETYLQFLRGLGVQAGSATKGGEGKDLDNGHGVMDKFAPWRRPIAPWRPPFAQASKPCIPRLHDYLL